MDEIARHEGVSRATVARILASSGLNRLSNLEVKPPVRRYEHPYPGAMVYLDIKKLGCFHMPGHRVTGVRRKDSKGVGWEHAHVAIDDHPLLLFIGFASNFYEFSLLTMAEKHFDRPGGFLRSNETATWLWKTGCRMLIPS